jgi:hypothetical protein
LEASGIIVEDRKKAISCDSFQRVQCKNCGFYEDGFFLARYGKIAKNPEDACEYDAVEFL